MKPYHTIQRFTAVFLFLGLCLQSCIPSLKQGYAPQTQGHSNEQEILTNLEGQIHLVPADCLKQGLALPDSPSLHPMPSQRLQAATANGAIPTSFPGVLPTQQVSIAEVTPALAQAEQGAINLESSTFTTSSGAQVRFRQEAGIWKAEVIYLLSGENPYSEILPIFCQENTNIQATLKSLAKEKTSIHKYRIHVVDNVQPPYAPKYVYLGERGIKGGMLEEKEIAFPVHQANGSSAGGIPNTALQPEEANLLERLHVEELRRVVFDSVIHGAPDKEQLVKALTQLASLHQEQGLGKRDLAQYTDAAILYQHVLTTCGEDVGFELQREASYEGLAAIKQGMLTICKPLEDDAMPKVTAADIQAEIAKDKGELEKLREYAQKGVDWLEKLEPQDEAAYIEGSRVLFAHIAKEIRSFLARLYQEAAQVLGPAPCKYAIMGLGSMALQQMTPYSDLEFCILIEENEDKEILEAHRAYFRKLSHLVNFRVINLGETVLDRARYKNDHGISINLDHLGTKAINFDLGGKTPLGRKDKPYYDLIQPVSEMLRYMKNEDNKIEHIDKLLPFILENTCYVHGDQALYGAYINEKDWFLTHGQTEQGAPVYKARALQHLIEGVVEMDYNKPGLAVVGRCQPGNLADFAPKLFDPDNAGKLYDVKQEIYRLPDRLLYRLATYYGLLPENAWDAADQLATNGIVRAQGAAHHLQYAVSFATMLRLKTYLHHGQQKESLSVLSGMNEEETQQGLSKAFLLPSAALQEGGSLFKYYYIALPLHSKMQEFFKNSDLRQLLATIQQLNPAFVLDLEILFGTNGKSLPSQEESFFQEEAFYNDSTITRADIHMRLMQYEAAKGCYEEYLRLPKKSDDQDSPALASSLNSVGIAYYTLGDAKKALWYYEQALEMEKKLYPEGHPDIASSLNNVGNAYKALGETRKALQYFEQALTMSQKIYPAGHPVLAFSMNNVGAAYEALGEIAKGLKYFEEGLAMYQKLYPDAHPHIHIADSLNNVGSAYQVLGDAQESLRYFEQALAMYQRLYPDGHPALAGSLNNVGVAYNALGEVLKGLKYFEQAMKIHQKLYPDGHPALAASLNNLGNAYYALNVYYALGDAQQILEYYEQGLEMYRKFYSEDHPDIATSLNNVGLAYQSLGEAKKGLGYFEQALEMRKKLYPAGHPHIANSLLNVGVVYEALGEVVRGLRYYEQALEMYQQLYPEGHPDIATSLFNVGNAYKALGEVSKGLKYYEQALELRKKLYPEGHLDIADSLNNVGAAYEALGEVPKGLEYYAQALEMYRNFYSKEHLRIQKVKQNLAKLLLEQVTQIMVARLYQAAVASYEQQDLAGAISNYAEALKLPIEDKNIRSSIHHNLGCMHYVAFMESMEQEHIDKATTAFEAAVAESEVPRASLCTEYANFLLNIGQLPQAYGYLIQASASGEAESELSYGLLEQATVTPLLQTKITQEAPVQVRGIDYAFYLLIHHYEDFRQAEIVLEKNQTEYLAAYEQGIIQRAGKPGKEQEDETASYLLAGLQEELGKQPALKQAFIVADQQQIALFVKACVAGQEDMAKSMDISSFEKDLQDDKGNPLICWMAQNAMGNTLEQVLKLGWNPNLPNTSHTYPLHYGVMKSPHLTKLLRHKGANPFVQTAKGNTPAQVARGKGKVASLEVLLPPIKKLSFTDLEAFEASYKAYKQKITHNDVNDKALLIALEVALQLGDITFVQTIQAKSNTQQLIKQLSDKYALPAEAIQARFESLVHSAELTTMETKE